MGHMDARTIEVGRVYTVARQATLGGLEYTDLYDGEQYVNVRVSEEVPDEQENGNSSFICTTIGEGNVCLGPGNVWIKRSDIELRADDLEPLKS
jgi:hypothetical protein